MYFRLLFVFLVLLFLGREAIAQSESLIPKSTVLVDSASSLTIKQIATTGIATKFGEYTDAIKNQSFTDFTYWIKFRAPINASYYVVSDNIFIDTMTLYSPSANAWETQSVGLLAPSNNGHSVLSIKIPEAAKGQICYLQVQSNCISKLDLWVVNENTLLQKESFKVLFYTIIIVLILVYFVAVLFLSIVNKKQGMLILGIYALASVLMILFTNGFLYQWLPHFNPQFYLWSFAYVVDIYWGSAALLSFYIFDVKAHSTALKKVFYVAFFVLVLLMITPLFLDRQLVAKIHFAVPMVFIIFNTFIGFYLFLKKNVASAIYLSVGWLIYFGLLIIWAVSKMSHLPNSFFIDNAPVFGLIIEFILFATIGAKHYLVNQEQNSLIKNKLSEITQKKDDIEQSYLKVYNVLTKREKEVLALMSSGCLDKEIANELGLGLSSVRTYSKRIYDKLKVSNRTEASIIYNNLKLIKSL